MAQTVLLTLTGRQQTADGEEAVTRTEYPGQFYEKNDSIYILYEEPPEDRGAAAKCCIKLKGRVLELTKKGAVCTRMVFEPGRELPADYSTPFGCIKLGVAAKKVEAFPGRESFRIRAEYDLTSQGRPFAGCSITIEAKYCNFT